MRFINLLIVFVLTVLGVSFAILNAKEVTVYYYLGSQKMPLVAALLIAFILGVLCGGLSVVKPLLKARRDRRKLQRQVRQAESELENLRHLPIRDEH